MRADLKMWQMRNFIEDRINSMQSVIDSMEEHPESHGGLSTDFQKGYIYALETIKVTYLLTDQERTESGRVRRELFG